MSQDTSTLSDLSEDDRLMSHISATASHLLWIPFFEQGGVKGVQGDATPLRGAVSLSHARFHSTEHRQIVSRPGGGWLADVSAEGP